MISVSHISLMVTLAANLEFGAIIIESDSQICSNLLADLESGPPWRIKPICANSWVLLASSPKVSVCWVPRLCSVASYSLVMWPLACNFFGSFDFGNNPTSSVSIIQGEACLPV